MTGQYRYYDGLVHYLSMLHLSGTFKIWKPKPTVEKKTVEGTEYNGVTYDKETTINAFEGCKLYEVTITGKQSAPVVDAAIAITSVKAMNAARVWSTNSAIVIENVAAGTNFSVTDMNGRVMMKSKVSSASHEIPMSNKGAFLVMVGNKTFKVIK